MTTTTINPPETCEVDTDSTRERADWQIAGDAWAHAALDWAYGFEPYARDAIEVLFDALEVGPGHSLMDMACGSGYALSRAERLGARTAGIDASEGLIDIARRRAPNTDLVAGTMFALPWEDDSFDAVTSFNGIWGGCQEAVEEAYRVLRPGGLIAMTFWGPGRALDLRDFFIVVGAASPGAAEEMKGLASIGAPGVCEAMLETAGFGDIERGATSSVLEATSTDQMWRTLRSPGVVLPSLEHVGEDALRSQVLAAVEPFRAPDGSYRLVNELTHVIARKPASASDT